MSNYSDSDLENISAYGVSGNKGESSALLDDLRQARSEIKRLQQQLELPLVKEALARHRAETKLAEATRLQGEAFSELNRRAE